MYWMCCNLILVTCEKAKVAVLTSGPWEVAKKKKKSRIDQAKRHSISPQQDFQSHSLLATFLLLGHKPCHETFPIHHRLLAPVTELKLWHNSLGNVLLFLHCSISVLMCTLGIVLDLFWCRVMTAFQRTLPSLTCIAFKVFAHEKAILWNNPVVCLRCFKTCLQLSFKRAIMIAYEVVTCFSPFTEQRHRGADAWGVGESHQWALHCELNKYNCPFHAACQTACFAFLPVLAASGSSVLNL